MRTSLFLSSTVTIADIATVVPTFTTQFQFEAEIPVPKLRQPGGAKIFKPGASASPPDASTTFPLGRSTAVMPGGRSLAVINRKTAWLP